MKKSANKSGGRKRSPWKTLLIVMLSITGVTLNSDIEAVNELYATKPMNIYHSNRSEDIVFSDDVSAGYRYVDRSSFQINVDTLNGEVNEIFYCYIAGE